jgi:hypothetical protein
MEENPRKPKTARNTKRKPKKENDNFTSRLTI